VSSSDGDRRPGPVALVIFDYGGVISERMLEGLAEFEIRMDYPTGSVHRLLFGDTPPHRSTPQAPSPPALGGKATQHLGDGDPVDGAHEQPSGSGGTAPGIRAASERDRVVDDGQEVHDFHLLETGDLGFHEYLEGVTRRAPEHLGRELEPHAFMEFMQATGVRVQWPIVHEIRRLRDAGVPLALLTNNVKEFGDAWRSSFPVDDLFGIVIDSSEVGMRKPDPRIYQLTCERAGVATEDSVFLDDNRDNVAAARALGIETVHVGSDPIAVITELAEILERRGVRTR
jgi:epoxide hydrolase-like predicted phosphatase